MKRVPNHMPTVRSVLRFRVVVQRALTIQHQVGPESDLAGWTMVDNAPGRSAAETDYNLVSAGISRIGRAILAPYEFARGCKLYI